MKEENFSTYEDDIIAMLDKLSLTISSFNTLSKDQAESAILEANIKISNCKEILTKMEDYVKRDDLDEEINKNELNQKITQYRTEYHQLLNKYNLIQNNYISRKTENALIDKDSNLEEDNHNKIMGTSENFVTDGELKNDINKNDISKNEINKNDISKNEINKNDISKNEINRTSNESNNTNDISLISVHNTSNLPQGMGLSASYVQNAVDNAEVDEDKEVSAKEKFVFICVCCWCIVFLILIIIIFAW